ncbi:protein-L-isoaspartate O-methyltransferase [Candidatus Desantisbacteria bacterium CG_4_9_14_3_um_filter_50_7]|nr:MAG: protein-L-isoaspartate O-methyltransferase [Candidatus Desantisbacteria bacterium CG_4_9_14_3_um_filter_50_7]
MDYEREREEMVRTQVEFRGVTDRRVLDAMRRISREEFAGEKYRAGAYEDHPLSIGEGQTISQPYIVALMTQLLRLSGKEKVLEVGTGSGYQTALLAELGGEIYSVERCGKLAQGAAKVLERLGYKNVRILAGDGTEGLKEYAPFDRIIVTAAAPKVPEPLVEQLCEGGIIVIPAGSLHSQELQVVEKKNNKIHITNHGGCVFVPLVGRYGWQENDI